MANTPLHEAILADDEPDFLKHLIPEYLYIKDDQDNTPLALSIINKRVNFSRALATFYTD